MLTANLKGKRINAEDVGNRKNKYLCPFCEKKMMLVKPISNIVDHFRHYNLCPHQGEPESPEHLNGKKYLYELFKKYTPELEKKLSNGQIADLYLKKNNIAIELQCSNISLSEFEKRNRGYKKLDIEVVWIFGTKKYLKHYIDKYGYATSFRLSIIERRLLEIQEGIFYLSEKELKRIFFNKYLGMETKYDIDKTFVVNDKDFFGSEEITKYILHSKHMDILNETYTETYTPNPPKTYYSFPATDKQINYLKKLGHSNPEGLDKKEASEWISFFKNEQSIKENNSFFKTGGYCEDKCPMCGKKHRNYYTSYCSNECYGKMIRGLKFKENPVVR